MTRSDEANRAPASTMGQVVIMILAGLLAVFAMGLAAGMITAASEHDGPHSLAFYGVLAFVALMFVGSIWLLVRNRVAISLPSSPRMRKTGVILYACAALGLISGAALTIIEGPEGLGIDTLASPDPSISPAGAYFLLATLLATLVLSVRWHMLLDEHERTAYDFGAVAAIYLYFILSAGWWVLAIGGLAPAPDGVIIFWLVMAAWLIGWLVRRYR